MRPGGTVVVTGGGRGIGAGIARRLAADGFAVAVNYARDEAAAGAVVEAIVAAGGTAKAIRADVGVPDEVAALFAEVDRAMPALVGLVNNAGVLGPTRRIDEQEADAVAAVMQTNVVGTVLCAKEAIRRLSTRHGGPGGAIVNIGSVAATTGGITGMAVYAASKGAIATLTIGLAREVAREGIRVNAVSPGMIVTDMTEGVAEAVAPSIPMGRCGRPDEIAAAVAWLLSDAASYATGSILTVSGGR